MNIHPQIISKNDLPEFVVLPYEEYQNLLVTLEEREDIKEIFKRESNIEKFLENSTENFLNEI